MDRTAPDQAARVLIDVPVAGHCGGGATVRICGVTSGPLTADECILCRPELADAQFKRTRIWEDEHWRLSAVLQGPIAGFAHLEPRRHIPFITDLDGTEAATLGFVLSRAARTLRQAAHAEKTYVYVFGDRTPHLHFNLAPHSQGDALRGGSGLVEPDVEEVALAVHQAVAEEARLALANEED